MSECNVEQNKAACSCTYEPCSRKGNCCQCVKYHQAKGELPACFFPADVERNYDRSIKIFVETYQTRERWW